MSIMDEAKRWIAPSNEAVTVALCHQSDPSKTQQFHPAFTYPIFGDEEVIFGYEDLDIRLEFDAGPLDVAVKTSYKSKFKPIGETVAQDINEMLKPFLPTFYEKDAQQQHKQEKQPFVPPGELLHEYDAKGRHFGIWSALLTDPRAKQMLRHAQILVPMFIEGGLAIELDDPEWTIDRWRVFFIYAMDQGNAGETTYSFAGYSTAYRLFFLDTDKLDQYTLLPSSASASDIASLPYPPPSDPTLQGKMPSRQRISQFLILPPYQTAGHGAHLYNTMITTFLGTPQVKEITVEDPNESFDRLRDINDLLRLRSDAAWRAQSINADMRLPTSRKAPVPLSSIFDTSAQTTSIPSAARLCPRQLARLTEMQLLSAIPTRNRAASRITRRDKASDALDRAYFFWRLLVKARLHRFNRDALMQLDPEERADHLELTLPGVESEYEGVLAKVDERAARGYAPFAPASSDSTGKRKRLVGRGRGAGAAGAMGEGDAGKGANGEGARPKKRVRIEDDEDEEL